MPGNLESAHQKGQCPRATIDHHRTSDIAQTDEQAQAWLAVSQVHLSIFNMIMTVMPATESLKAHSSMRS